MDQSTTLKYIYIIVQWTKTKKMKLNTDKSKYMIVKFATKYQANTRLKMEDNLLEQVQHIIVASQYKFHYSESIQTYELAA